MGLDRLIRKSKKIPTYIEMNVLHSATKPQTLNPKHSLFRVSNMVTDVGFRVWGWDGLIRNPEKFQLA